MKPINKILIRGWANGISDMFIDAKSCTRHGCKYRPMPSDDCAADPDCIVHADRGEGTFISLMTLTEEEPDDR